MHRRNCLPTSGRPGRTRTISHFVLLASLLAAAACGSSNSATDQTDGLGGAAGSGVGGGSSQPPPSGPTGLPCDVQTLLADRCWSCHGYPLAKNVPMQLITYEQLTAPSKSEPAKTVAALSVERMSATKLPMPPGPDPHATPAEIAVMDGWVKAGTPKGDACGGTGGAGGGVGKPNPYDTPSVCTSGSYWNKKTAAAYMAPGEACIACHLKYPKEPDARKFTIAGTVYPTAHEPDDCNGVATKTSPEAIVEITDANGVVTNIPVNLASYKNNVVGNFFTEVAIAMPYTARVLYDGRERAMVKPKNSGDCNGCHTEQGTTTETEPMAETAPGRIMLP